MNLYKCLTKQQYSISRYKVSPIRSEDRFQIMHWRNAQMDVLRQSRILTKEDQENYFKKNVSPLFEKEHPEQLLFSFFFDDTLIGYGGLVHINWSDRRGEISFLLNDKRAQDEDLYERDFTSFLTMMKDIAFGEIDFNRIYTETFDIRPLHISILEKNQFILEGRMKQHVNINNIYHDSLIHGFLKQYRHVQK